MVKVYFEICSSRLQLLSNFREGKVRMGAVTRQLKTGLMKYELRGGLANPLVNSDYTGVNFTFRNLPKTAGGLSLFGLTGYPRDPIFVITRDVLYIKPEKTF